MTDHHYNGNLLVNYVFLNPNLAVLLHSSDAAIALQELHYRCNDKQYGEQIFKDGKTWVSDPIRILHIAMPWLSVDMVKRMINRLIKDEYIIVSDELYRVNLDKVTDDGED